MRTSDLRFGVENRQGVTVARPVGVLDATTYPEFRDTLLKYAAEQPDGLIVDVDRLRMPSSSALSVFSLVSMRVADWPGVPVLLVVRDDCQREATAARFAPVYASITAAMSAVDTYTPRSTASLELPPSGLSTRHARYFVRKTCERWHVADMVTDAMTVATAFVENTLKHTDSMALLRMQLRRGLLTLTVSDDDPRPAVMRERLEGGVSPCGLLLVSAVARSWGCTPTFTGGKTVWAALRLPTP
ncbi:anti-sigma factor antagonist [Kibdelosporangium phytohabitans]|uniref:STAS domain-containing protein n=1 Tax=Kibdelosporangium phytohabitans TaxID=860235 RepID=A0A0N9I1L5_9PSEU|nr:anti-sigma factor antagonist [Kibdelosporangium phytohabitans]ALG11461.1 hypothetical protein AOZ06_35455 [Kibdelosporangium phytohabitans]MBE1462806.1 hypothetical protein [Kibdelosporangium phytohabitans]